MVALGLAGGLVPSPSALLILLATMAVGRWWLGLLAVIAFGAGMAITLTITGMVAAAGGRRVVAFFSRGRLSVRWGRLAPRFTGVAVVAAGAALVLRGLLQSLAM